ncbi:MAG: hypothetical protein ABI383_12155 [Acidobacteriaceae bacterium]
MIKSAYRPTAALLALCLPGCSVAAFAQSSTPPPAAQGSNSRQINGATVDPVAAPQSAPAQGVPGSTAANTTTEVPEAPAPVQRETLPLPPPTQAPNAGQGQAQSHPSQPPAGAATAEKGVTRGGVASRPAGVAIAPAKQRQMRSFLIKTGAILFGAVAIGTVYALHRSTSSYPPGSGH